jgi:cytochrome d ubiquinol oxidase subunit I
MELGWVTTEVGRQPWVVYGLVRTEDAVTAAGGIVWTATAISVIYVVLGVVTVGVLRSMSRRFASGEEIATPYGPPGEVRS